MNQNSLLFELMSAGLLATSGACFYFQGYAGPGLLIVSAILFFLTLALRGNEIASSLKLARLKLVKKSAYSRIESRVY